MTDKESVRKKVLQMVEVGFVEDGISRAYDYINLFAVLSNLAVCILFTFDNIYENYGGILTAVETFTVFFFFMDYVLRVWTAELLYPNYGKVKAVCRYLLSLAGIVDLLSFLPFFLPVFFPGGSVAFRMLRVARIFRIFRINAYYDSLNVITAVISSKKQQLLSSVFILVILMIASSLCMYSIENPAQPEVFSNAFSGIWWATSTLLTVGYGDIYPITTAGKLLGIVITFLGVGVVAIPTGIISAGFVEQYTKIREMIDEQSDRPIHFIKIHIRPKDPWVGRSIQDMAFPKDVIIAAIQRKGETIVPYGDVILLEGDTIVFGAKEFHDDWSMTLQELTIKKMHPWNGVAIKDLDISRQSFIVTIQRGEQIIVPYGDFKIKTGDVLTLYSKKRIQDSAKIN